MKRTLSVLTTVLVAGIAMAQEPTFVSTTPGGRCVLIEEYTGINCYWCPAGHKLANEVLAAHPDSAFAINIHEGGYAAAYTTQWGSALANQTGLQGYPAGTVNRHIFGNYYSQGGHTSLNRGYWPDAANEVLAMSSPCNVATQVSFDMATREVTVTVEVYYTSSSANSTNMLNIALVQDNVLGAQEGAEDNYPEMTEGSLYRHNHMLRHLLTGQWGDTIHSTTQGSFFTKQYTYTLPQFIGDVPIGMKIFDLELITFVTETRQEVLTATAAKIPLNDPIIYSLESEPAGCDFAFTPVLTIYNPLDMPVSDLHFEADGVQYTLGRTIAAGQTDTLHLNTITIADHPEAGATATIGQELACEMTSYTKDGQAVSLSGNTFTGMVGEATVYGVDRGVKITVLNDQNGGTQTTLRLTSLDGSCDTVWTKEPSAADNNAIRNYLVGVDAPGFYHLVVTDAGGDGMSLPAKGVRVKDYDNQRTLFTKLGNYGDGFEAYFYVAEALGIEGASEARTLVLYPNPVADVLHVDGATEADRLEVSDLEGRIVLRGQGASISTASLPAGVYMLRLTTAEGTAVQKFVKE